MHKVSTTKVSTTNVLFKYLLILFFILLASLLFIHNKAFAYSAPDPNSGVSFSPRAIGIPQYGNTDYRVTYTNNSASAIKDIHFGPGGTSGVGSSSVQLVSVSGCDSVSISPQKDYGTCFISIPVGASKTITASFSNGGWTVSTNNVSFNYIPINADEVNGTSISLAPNVAVFTGVNFSPALFYIPQYGNANYTVTYTNNSASAIKDILFGPGGTTGVGSSSVQLVSVSGCDSVSISPQKDYGTCFISIPVGASKTITASFSNGGWTNGRGDGTDGWQYIPASADEVDGTSISINPYMYMSNPVVNPFPGATINVGDTYTANGSFTDPNSGASSWTATVGYGDGSGSQPLTLSGTNFTLNHTYTLPGTYTVSVSVTNDQGYTGIGTATITVNAPPHVNTINNATVNEGDTYSASGSFTDPDSTSWTATVDYGEGAGTQPLTLSGMNFSLSHQYNISGTHTVTVSVTDNQGSTGTGTATITVNAPPQVSAFNGATVNEGDTYTQSSSFTDPDSTSWTATVDYGDGAGPQPLTLSGTNFSLSHQYKDEGTYTVTVKVTDNQGATGTGTASVTVNNAPFTIGTISPSSSVVQVNSQITASASYTDPGALDTHTASWNWGDGNTTTGTVTETNGSGSVSDTHTYSTAGVYAITLTVTDDDGVSSSQQFQYESVYNPTSQGLFSAGQRFSSPAGAYPQNSSLTGNVTFGLSYKYQGTMPVGDRQFTMNFKAASLLFNATTVSSLVVANNTATLTGTGTINGSGSYNFLVTGVNGGDIRIQITDPANNNNVIYDTQPGAAATANPTTSVNGQVIAHN